MLKSYLSIMYTWINGNISIKKILTVCKNNSPAKSINMCQQKKEAKNKLKQQISTQIHIMVHKLEQRLADGGTMNIIVTLMFSCMWLLT